MNSEQAHRRTRGLLKYLRRNIARKYLRSVAKEHIEQFDQLVVFGFDNLTTDVMLYGQQERYVLEFVSSQLAGFIKDKTVLDVGANIGNHSVAFAKLARQVISFEPNPAVFELLQINTRKYPNVRCFNFGASDCDRTVKAVVPQGRTGSGTISDSASAPIFRKPRSNLTEIQFEVKRLDGIPSITDSSIGMIKIDVEGHELGALKGMEKILQQQKPLILFEQNRNIQNGTSKEVDFLKQHGYNNLYEFEMTQQWITPNWLPKILMRICRALEVFLAGEPSQTLGLNRLPELSRKSYPVLLASAEPLM